MEVQYLWSPVLCQVRLVGMSSSGKTDILCSAFPRLPSEWSIVRGLVFALQV